MLLNLHLVAEVMVEAVTSDVLCYRCRASRATVYHIVGVSHRLLLNINRAPTLWTPDGRPRNFMPHLVQLAGLLTPRSNRLVGRPYQLVVLRELLLLIVRWKLTVLLRTIDIEVDLL